MDSLFWFRLSFAFMDHIEKEQLAEILWRLSSYCGNSVLNAENWKEQKSLRVLMAEVHRLLRNPDGTPWVPPGLVPYAHRGLDGPS